MGSDSGEDDCPVTPGYALVPLVRPGDIVVHYNSRQEAVVGVSRVIGPAEPTPVFWVSRGVYARRAGDQAKWLPGIRAPLGQYQELKPAITLAEIKAKRDTILAIRGCMQAGVKRQPIYFPWTRYRDTLRTYQSYLAKMPQEAIDLLPRLRAAVAYAEITSPGIEATSPVEQAEEAVEAAAGKVAGRGKGQGFQVDQGVKVAVEAHAMNVATEFYGEEWDVEDVHGKESYDLVCRRDGKVKHVEVKGTTTDGDEVILTPNEVRHAETYQWNALFILSNVKVGRAEDGTVIATGRVHHLYDPWNLNEGTLTPIGYRNQVRPAD
jgi:hypothetical protein